MSNISLVSQVPIYVWAVLALLLVLGLRQRRDRWVSRQGLLALPLCCLAYSLWSLVNIFGAVLIALLPWLATLLLTLLGGHWADRPKGLGFDAQRQRFFVPGSWLPLALMLSLFATKFALGMSQGLHADALQHAPVVASFSAVLGGLSGALLARALFALKGQAPNLAPLPSP